METVTDNALRSTLKEVFGYNRFRGNQEEIHSQYFDG